LAVSIKGQTVYPHVLGGARIAEENGSTLADKEVINACRVECFGYLLGLKRIEWQAVVHSAGAGLKPR
jgi:phosphopantothenate synthetase